MLSRFYGPAVKSVDVIAQPSVNDLNTPMSLLLLSVHPVTWSVMTSRVGRQFVDTRYTIRRRMNATNTMHS